VSQSEHRDADAVFGKWADPESDDPAPAEPGHRTQMEKAAVAAAPCTPDAGPFAARSCGAPEAQARPEAAAWPVELRVRLPAEEPLLRALPPQQAERRTASEDAVPQWAPRPGV
jgi:hypothetical protein